MALPDPFPLLHLADLTFPLTDIGSLSSAQLALAPYSAEYDDALEKKVVRTWRQRREKNRAKIGTVPIGQFADPAERAKEQWPLFELIDLSWPLEGVELDTLTSAQLAVIAFHPDSKKELVQDAEDVFFSRRERDFNAGLSLPPLPAPPALSQTPSQPPPASSAPPASTSSASSRAPATAPPPPASRPASNGGSSHAWLDEDVEMKAPAPSAPESNRTAPPRRITLDEHRRIKEEEAREAQRLEDAVKESRSREAEAKEIARKQREDDDAKEVKRRDDARRVAAEQAAAEEKARMRQRTPVGRTGSDEREKEGDRRREHRSRYGDDDERGTPRDRDDDRAERKRVRPAEFEEDQDKSSSTSRRRRSSVTSRDARARSRERERERGRDGDVRSSHDRPSSRDRRSSRDSGGFAKRDYGFVPADQGYIPRIIDRVIRDGSEDIPPDLREVLKIIYIVNVPRQAVIEQIRTMLLSIHQVAPVGIKIAPNGEGSHVFAAFLLYSDASEVARKLKGHGFLGKKLGAEFAKHSNDKRHASWSWRMMDRFFREQWSAGEIRLPKPGFDDVPSAQAPAPYPTRTEGPQPPQSHPSSSYREHERRISTTSSSVPSEDDGYLPHDLVASLSFLYISNCPEFVTVEELRTYFDSDPGLVGLSLGGSNVRFHNSSAWLVFSDREDRDKAMFKHRNAVLPHTTQKIYMEEGERNGKIKRDLRWLEMAKDFRQKHRRIEPSPHASQAPIPIASSHSSAPHSAPRSPRSHAPVPPQAPRGSTSSSQASEKSALPPLRKSSSSTIDAGPISPALSDRLRPAPAKAAAAASPPITPVSARLGAASLPSKPIFALRKEEEDEGYAPDNPGGLGLSLHQSQPRNGSGGGGGLQGKVHPSRIPHVPAAPSSDLQRIDITPNLSQALTALIPLAASYAPPANVPQTHPAAYSPPSTGRGSAPPVGPRGRSAYERPTAASLSSFPEDDMNPLRDWTSWKPAPGSDSSTSSSNASRLRHSQPPPTAPAAFRSAPHSPQLPISRVPTPTGPRSLSIKGSGSAPGSSKSPSVGPASVNGRSSSSTAKSPALGSAPLSSTPLEKEVVEVNTNGDSEMVAPLGEGSQAAQAMESAGGDDVLMLD